MNKVLSIIIPSYNMERYLPTCLGSLMVDDRENRSKLDVIVVNDGSKDGTSACAHQWEEKYPGVIRVLDKTNGNYGSCINAGLKIACGRFVRVLDADDYYDRGNLGRFVDFLQSIEDETVDAVFSDYDRVDLSGAFLRRFYFPFPSDRAFAVKEMLPVANTVFMHALTYRTNLLREMNYSQTEGISYTDCEFVVLPMSRVRSMVYFPEVIYHYRVGRDGQTIGCIATERAVGMFRKIFANIAGELRGRLSECEDDNRTFVCRYMQHLIEMVYSGFAREYQYKKAVRAFNDYDDYIRHEFGIWYGFFSDYTLGAVGWRYIKKLRAYRNHLLVAHVYLALIRFYYILSAVKQKLRHAVQH